MSVNRVLLLYADDERRVERLKEHLEKANIEVIVPDANLGSTDFNENLVDKLITNEKYIIFFVSDAISQKSAETDFLFAYN